MSEKNDEPEALSGVEALALARKGKGAWNAWAVENEGWGVDFSGVNFTTEENEAISFKGFTFPGDVSFSNTKFKSSVFVGVTFEGVASFKGAIFEREAVFADATFKGTVRFDKATFEKDAMFARATFEGAAQFGLAIFKGRARFSGVVFTGPVSLEHSQFFTVPDFRRSEFQKHVTLHGVCIKFRRSAKGSDADMYRRLKEIAVTARDHDREQLFFAWELKAKRGHETRGLALAPNYFYEWTSDFGRSLWRPTVGLLAVWFAFGNHYRWLASKDMDHLSDGLLFSTAQLFPFISASKGVLAEAKVALFGTGTVGNWVNTFSVIEGLLGIVFLFLIGLALRNRFRI